MFLINNWRFSRSRYIKYMNSGIWLNPEQEYFDFESLNSVKIYYLWVNQLMNFITDLRKMIT